MQFEHGQLGKCLRNFWYDSAICRQDKKCKKHGGFPTEVSDMARNMKMELLTLSLILYQSKNCGHRIHVLFMMYDVYWYCQMKKNEWLWKFWKTNDLYENFEKKGGSREKGEEEMKSMPHAPVEVIIHTLSKRDNSKTIDVYFGCF